MSTDRFAAVERVLTTALRLARQAPTGRILLARVASSIDFAWLPPGWQRDVGVELESALEAASEPVPMAEVERILRRSWDVPPTQELEELDPEPVAITPTAQVHRGELEGDAVAIKVLRPGIAAAVRQDLMLLGALISPLGAAFPRTDPVALLDEFRERVLDELDLEHEAETQRRFHRALRRHPEFVVPAPVMPLSRADVLVGEWVGGASLWDAPDPDAASAQLLRFVLGSAHYGLVHADPHPDDVRILDDGRVAILDFGATRPVVRERWALAVQVVESVVAEDVTRLGAALDQLGWLPGSQAQLVLDLSRQALGDFLGPESLRLDVAAVVGIGTRLFGQSAAVAELLGAGALAPEDLWPLRGVLQALAGIARVGASGSWREQVLAGLQEGWRAPSPTPPGASSR